MSNPRIDELKKEIANWERVHDHQVQEIRDENGRFKQTLSTVAKIVAVGSIPSVVWAIHWAFALTEGDSWLAKIFMAGGILLVLSIPTAAAARGGALLAHLWFRNNPDRQRLATVFIGLFAATFVLAWVLVVLR